MDFFFSSYKKKQQKTTNQKKKSKNVLKKETCILTMLALDIQKAFDSGSRSDLFSVLHKFGFWGPIITAPILRQSTFHYQTPGIEHYPLWAIRGVRYPQRSSLWLRSHRSIHSGCIGGHHIKPLVMLPSLTRSFISLPNRYSLHFSLFLGPKSHCNVSLRSSTVRGPDPFMVCSI